MLCSKRKRTGVGVDDGEGGRGGNSVQYTGLYSVCTYDFYILVICKFSYQLI